MKQCIACGMPMEKIEDFAMKNQEKNYCRYCCNKDGTMQSYEEKLNAMTKFIFETKNLDIGRAREAAKSALAKLPAWKNN